MSGIKTVTPAEVQLLMQAGWIFVDVRSEPEFEAGHVPGALNVPLQQAQDGRLIPNPDFAQTMEASFGRGENIIVACKAGGRSAQAAQLLSQSGFQNIANMTVGWEGNRDAFGRLTPGWARLGLPTEQGAPAGQVYTDVKQRRP